MTNVVVIVGRLASDPELRTTTSGKSVVSFTVAVQKRTKPSDGSSDADFFRCSAWDKTAEYVSNYLSKGRLIAVEGRLQSRKYVASDGSNREVVEIVANNVQSLERPRDDGQAQPAQPAPSADTYDPWSDA